MKAAPEQRSAVMDGKTCGRRKSRKKCAEKPWKEEDRMSTGRSERGGGQKPQHSLRRSFHMKAAWKSVCFLSPSRNTPLFFFIFYRSARVLTENKAPLMSTQGAQCGSKHKNAPKSPCDAPLTKSLETQPSRCYLKHGITNIPKAPSTQETKGRSWDVWMHLHTIISPTHTQRLDSSQILERFFWRLVTAVQNLNFSLAEWGAQAETCSAM